MAIEMYDIMRHKSSFSRQDIKDLREELDGIYARYEAASSPEERGEALGELADARFAAENAIAIATDMEGNGLYGNPMRHSELAQTLFDRAERASDPSRYNFARSLLAEMDDFDRAHGCVLEYVENSSGRTAMVKLRGPVYAGVLNRASDGHRVVSFQDGHSSYLNEDFHPESSFARRFEGKAWGAFNLEASPSDYPGPDIDAVYSDEDRQSVISDKLGSTYNALLWRDHAYVDDVYVAEQAMYAAALGDSDSFKKFGVSDVELDGAGYGVKGSVKMDTGGTIVFDGSPSARYEFRQGSSEDFFLGDLEDQRRAYGWYDKATPESLYKDLRELDRAKDGPRFVAVSQKKGITHSDAPSGPYVNPFERAGMGAAPEAKKPKQPPLGAQRRQVGVSKPSDYHTIVAPDLGGAATYDGRTSSSRQAVADRVPENSVAMEDVLDAANRPRSQVQQQPKTQRAQTQQPKVQQTQAQQPKTQQQQPKAQEAQEQQPEAAQSSSEETQQTDTQSAVSGFDPDEMARQFMEALRAQVAVGNSSAFEAAIASAFAEAARKAMSAKSEMTDAEARQKAMDSLDDLDSTYTEPDAESTRVVDSRQRQRAQRTRQAQPQQRRQATPRNPREVTPSQMTPIQLERRRLFGDEGRLQNPKAYFARERERQFARISAQGAGKEQVQVVKDYVQLVQSLASECEAGRLSSDLKASRWKMRGKESPIDSIRAGKNAVFAKYAFPEDRKILRDAYPKVPSAAERRLRTGGLTMASKGAMKGAMEHLMQDVATVRTQGPDALYRRCLDESGFRQRDGSRFATYDAPRMDVSEIKRYFKPETRGEAQARQARAERMGVIGHVDPGEVTRRSADYMDLVERAAEAFDGSERRGLTALDEISMAASKDPAFDAYMNPEEVDERSGQVIGTGWGSDVRDRRSAKAAQRAFQRDLLTYINCGPEALADTLNLPYSVQMRPESVKDADIAYQVQVKEAPSKAKELLERSRQAAENVRINMGEFDMSGFDFGA